MPSTDSSGSQRAHTRLHSHVVILWVVCWADNISGVLSLDIETLLTDKNVSVSKA